MCHVGFINKSILFTIIPPKKETFLSKWLDTKLYEQNVEKNVSKMVREFLLRSWMCKDQIKKDIKLIKFIWFKFNLKSFKPWLFNKLYVCSVSTSFQNPLYQIAPVLHLASDLVKRHGCLILAMHWKDVFCLDWNQK